MVISSPVYDVYKCCCTALSHAFCANSLGFSQTSLGRRLDMNTCMYTIHASLKFSRASDSAERQDELGSWEVPEPGTWRDTVREGKCRGRTDTSLGPLSVNEQRERESAPLYSSLLAPTYSSTSGTPDVERSTMRKTSYAVTLVLVAATLILVSTLRSYVLAMSFLISDVHRPLSPHGAMTGKYTLYLHLIQHTTLNPLPQAHRKGRRHLQRPRQRPLRPHGTLRTPIHHRPRSRRL